MNNYDEIICILDRSGSMTIRRDDTIGGFNRFIEDQRKIGIDARVTLVTFADERTIVYNGREIFNVRPLDHFTYAPGGGTALLDAVGYTIDRVGDRLSNTPESERPKKVIVAILTDGEENASHEYTLNQVGRMIEHQRNKYKWEFFFLGANQDVWKIAQQMNIPRANAFMYDSHSAQGIAKGFSTYTASVAQARGDSFVSSSEPDDLT